MALDGAFLRHVKKEMETVALGARVDKIYQPNREEMVLSLRTRMDTFKLLLSARANSARVHFTQRSIENPKQPPMLCMLLRKRLGGARLSAIRQMELERVLHLDFDAFNELGDPVRLTLVIEIMGRYSNIIFVDQNGVIIDALKRVDEEMSSERLVLPGLRYRSPPPQHKLCMLEASPEQVVEQVVRTSQNSELSNALLGGLQGVSPVVCREIQHRVGNGEGVSVSDLTDLERQKLVQELNRVFEMVDHQEGKPCMVLHPNGKPLDFSFLKISQYGDAAEIQYPESFSKLLDTFYGERDRIERMKAKSQDIHRILTTAMERLSRKINVQTEELRQCTQRERLKVFGDLIHAHLYQIKKGDTVVALQNFYDESLPMVRISLNPLLTPSQNAQKYYKEYRKARTAEEKLTQQISQAKQELEYVDTVLDELSRAATERDLIEIRQELVDQGYIKPSRSKQQKGKESVSSTPMEFRTSDGFLILVGRNNRQNDRLTMKDAKNHDIWFHVKNHPGSHTILVTERKEPTDLAMTEAAQIAAYFSRCRDSSQVPVDYTQVRHVNKPQGAKPGMVIYVNYQTTYVTPSLPASSENGEETQRDCKSGGMNFE